MPKGEGKRVKQVLKEFSVKPKPVGKPRQYVPSEGGTAKTVKMKSGVGIS